MNKDEFDFDMEEALNELEALQKEIDLEIKTLFPDDEASGYEPYDYMDYFRLVENEIPENREGIYDWLEEWFQTYFGANLKGNDAYVLYSEEDQWEVCFPLKETSMEGYYHSPSKFETETHHIEFSSDGEFFVGSCSKDLLRDLIAVFKIWVETKEERIQSFAQNRGYSARLLQCIKKLVLDKRVRTRQDAIALADIYMDAIQLTTDFHMNLLWQIVLETLKNMSDRAFQTIRMKVIKEENYGV